MKHLFLSMLIAYIVGHIYLLVRGMQLLPNYPLVRWLWPALILLLSASFFIGMFMGRNSGELLALWSYHLGTAWLVPFLYLVLFALITDLLRLSNAVYPWFPAIVTTSPHFARVWALSGVVLIGAVCGFGFHSFRNPVVTHLRLDMPAKPGAPDSFTIALVSDIHLGRSVGPRSLTRYVKRIEALRPDLLLFGGDVLDHGVSSLEGKGMAAILKQLNPPYGVYAVPGNHEYYGGIDACSEWLESAGITLLRDKSVGIDSLFTIVGRDDRSARRRKSLSTLLEESGRDLPILLLDHQPYNLSEAERQKIFFQFSGHTHQGQVWPISLIVKGMYELSYGYRKQSDTHFYVSSGLALWGPPYRIGTRSEIVLLTLTFR